MPRHFLHPSSRHTIPRHQSNHSRAAANLITSTTALPSLPLPLISSSMNPRIILFALIALLFTKSFALLGADPQPTYNITVVGTVFCDACCNNSFSKNSYFLQGAQVLVECNFRVNSEEISITVDRITDKFGVYKVEIPPVDGFECKTGREVQSLCRARLIRSSSSLCSVPGLATSTEQLTIKSSETNLCVYNLNALSYRPANRDVTHCGAKKKDLLLPSSSSTSLNSSLFFWPPFFPPWPFPPWFPYPSPPSSFPIPLPPLFPSPPSLPFPFPPLFPTPSPPSLPFPFPPLFPTPTPPSLPLPFPPLPPIFPAPPPPPPSFPIPLPPLLPPFTPIPPFFAPPPPPPSPPPPSFPFPFPPLPPLIPAPNVPSPPPPPFSLRDPRTWFPYHPPSTPHNPQNQHP